LRMNVRKKRKLFLLVSSIFILLCFCNLGGIRDTLLTIIVNEDGIKDIRLSQKYTMTDIGLQSNYWGEGNYLFIPGYMELKDVHVEVTYESNSARDALVSPIIFDDVTLPEAEVMILEALEEGCHIVTCEGKSMEFQIMQGSLLPSMWIDTTEGMKWVQEDKHNATAGKVRLCSATGKIQYAGELQSLKGRGNSSWDMAKKSYGVKLTSSFPLLGMSSGKSWVLIGSGADTTGLRNKLFLDMALECGLDNAIEGELIDLYIDGEYYGFYLLSEKITIASGRLEIGDLEEKTQLLNEEPLETYPYYVFEENEKLWTGYSVPHQPENRSGGYLLEMEEYQSRFASEPIRFLTDNEHGVVVKEPEHATLAQVEYISDFIQDFEDALYAEDGYNAKGISYLEYIDLESFAIRYLIDEISKNVDAGFSSYFFYKPWNENRLYAGPVWDYDTALGNNRDWGDTSIMQNPQGMYANSSNWSKQLWEKAEFREATKEIYQKHFDNYLEKLLGKRLEDSIQTVKASAFMDQTYYDNEDWEEEVYQMKQFLQKRKEFLTEEFQ